MTFFHRPIFSDIRLWILRCAVIRSFCNTDPPLEPAHSWRQTTILMMALNFPKSYPRNTGFVSFQ